MEDRAEVLDELPIEIIRGLSIETMKTQLDSLLEKIQRRRNISARAAANSAQRVAESGQGESAEQQQQREAAERRKRSNAAFFERVATAEHLTEQQWDKEHRGDIGYYQSLFERDPERGTATFKQWLIYRGLIAPNS